MNPCRFARILVLVGLWLGMMAKSPALAQDDPPLPRPRPAAAASADPAKPGEAGDDLEKLTGTWLFESALMGDRSLLEDSWNSQLTIKGTAFKLSNFLGVQKDLTGTISLVPSGKPRKIDLNLVGLDLSSLNIPLKVPAGKLEGIYKLEGDRLELCISMSADLPRPLSFLSARLKSVAIQFGRVDPLRKSNGKDWKVLVIDEQGKPVAGAKVFPQMVKRPGPDGATREAEWTYPKSLETGADGMTPITVDVLKSGVLCGRSLEKKMIGYGQLTPVAAHRGVVTIQLHPETRVLGTLVSPELKKLDRPLGLTYTSLETDSGRVALNVSSEGKYEFFVPPGNYTISISGPEIQTKSTKMFVLPETTETNPDPISLNPQRTVFQIGEAAPELAHVLAWKGEPAKISQFKGKWVLLTFWGYWNSGSVDAMPILMDIQDKYKSKNVQVIGVHVDANGEIDTVAKYNRRIEPFQAAKWNERELPFPVALTSGQRYEEYKYDGEKGGPAGQYGIGSFPATVIISPEGKIVGCFPGTDPGEAKAKMLELLKKEEK